MALTIHHLHRSAEGHWGIATVALRWITNDFRTVWAWSEPYRAQALRRRYCRCFRVLLPAGLVTLP